MVSLKSNLLNATHLTEGEWKNKWVNEDSKTGKKESFLLLDYVKSRLRSGRLDLVYTWRETDCPSYNSNATARFLYCQPHAVMSWRTVDRDIENRWQKLSQVSRAYLPREALSKRSVLRVWKQDSCLHFTDVAFVLFHCQPAAGSIPVFGTLWSGCKWRRHVVGGDFSPVSEKLDLGLVIYISTSNTDGFFFQTLERYTEFRRMSYLLPRRHFGWSEFVLSLARHFWAWFFLASICFAFLFFFHSGHA